MSAELQQLLALLEARVNGKASQAAGEDEAGDLPSAGRYFADAIMQPGKLAAAGLAVPGDTGLARHGTGATSGAALIPFASSWEQ